MKDDAGSNMPPVLKWFVLLFKKKDIPSEERAAVNERMRKMQSSTDKQPRTDDSIITKNRAKQEVNELTDSQLSLAELIRKRNQKNDLPGAAAAEAQTILTYAAETQAALPAAQVPAQIAEPAPIIETSSQSRRWRSLRLVEIAIAPTESASQSPVLDSWSASPPESAVSSPNIAETQIPWQTSQAPLTAQQTYCSASMTFDVDEVNSSMVYQVQAPIEPLIDVRAIPIAEISNFLDLMFAEPDRPESGQSAMTSPAVSEQTPDPKSAMGRLKQPDPSDGPRGQITALGPFLLDSKSQQALNNLIVQTPSNAKVLTEAEAAELKNCLKPIEALDGVAGCIILGYDGAVIANSLPVHCDLDVFSSWALVTYMSSFGASEVLGRGKIQQVLSRTSGATLLLADFGQGLLLAVSDKTTTESVLPLMRGVKKVTAA